MKNLICCVLILCLLPLTALASQDVTLSAQGISLEVPEDWVVHYRESGDPLSELLLDTMGVELFAVNAQQTDELFLYCQPLAAKDFRHSRLNETFTYLQGILVEIEQLESLNVAATIYENDLIWFALDTNGETEFLRSYLTVQNSVMYILQWVSSFSPATANELSQLEETVRSAKFFENKSVASSGMTRFEEFDTANGIRLSFELPEKSKKLEMQNNGVEYMINFTTPQLQQVVISYMDASSLFAPSQRSPRSKMTTEESLSAFMCADFLASMSISTTDDAIKPLTMDRTSFFTCKGYPVGALGQGNELHYAIGVKNGYLFLMALNGMTDAEASSFYESFRFDQMPE
ncbi:MAG: hypothetical protein IJ461_02965 [Clostridia bacterium]|nr:hypothetical protein [Clostridia bacterium]